MSSAICWGYAGCCGFVWLWDGSFNPLMGVGKELTGGGLGSSVVVDRLARGVRQPIAAIRFAHTQCRFLIHKDFCECVVSSVRNFFERTD